MNVERLMHRNVVTCRPDETLLHAARLMWEHDVGALPVVDEDQHGVAMITDRDIAMAAYLTGLPLAAIDVRSAMSSTLYAAGLDEPLESVEERMREHQLHRVPVLNRNHQVVGIVSVNDIARAAAQTRRDGGERGLDPEVVTTTVATIAHPRVAAMVVPS